MSGMRKYLGFLALIFFVTGCQTPHTYYIPATAGQFPETSGKLFGGSVEAHFASATGVEVLRDYKANPPLTDNTTTNGSLWLTGSRLALNLGLVETFDLYFNKGVGIRWQYMGAPKATGWKGTLFAGGISAAVSTSTGTLGAANYAKAETKATGSEIGTSVGYTTTPGNTIFSNAVYSVAKARTQVEQDAGRLFNYEDDFKYFLLSLGARVGETWYFQYEVSATYVQWPRTSNTWVGGGNLGFGYQW